MPEVSVALVKQRCASGTIFPVTDVGCANMSLSITRTEFLNTAPRPVPLPPNFGLLVEKFYLESYSGLSSLLY